MANLTVMCYERQAPTDQATITIRDENSVLHKAQASLLPQSVPLGSPTTITIEVTPFKSSLWPLSGTFLYDGADGLTPVDGSGTPPELRASSLLGALHVDAHLSPLRDVTLQAEQSLGITWSFPSEATDILNDPPISGNRLDFSFLDAGAVSDDAILEIADVAVPRVIAVSWPNSLSRDPNFTPTIPFLLYFRPALSQNQSAYQGKSYPFDPAYLRYTLSRYLTYEDDPPLPDRRPIGGGMYSKGLIFQTAARNIVTVLASQRLDAEYGRWTDAVFVEYILGEVAAFFTRRAGFYNHPGFVGRVAAASFSSGAVFLADLLDWNKNTNLYQTLMREVYVFDAPDTPDGSGRPQSRRVTQQAIAWRGQDNQRLIRIYTQHQWIPEFIQLVGAAPATPGVTTSPDGSVRVLKTDIATWQATTQTYGTKAELDDVIARGFVDGGWSQVAHQMISATLLTDAMKVSGF